MAAPPGDTPVPKRPMLLSPAEIRESLLAWRPSWGPTLPEAVPLPETSSIQERLLSYWLSRKEDKFWDVYLVFDDGKELLCSKRDLCLMSQYFGKMFEGDFAESTEKKVPIKDVRSYVMVKMVESYYTGKVMLSEGIVRAIAVAADMFLFPHVSEACRQFLAGKLTLANAVKTLKMAEEILPLSSLRPKIIEYIRQHTAEWLSTNPYQGTPFRDTDHKLSEVSLSTMTEIMKDLKLKHERHKVYMINEWRIYQDSCGAEQTDSSTPDCLLDTIDFSRLRPTDVPRLLQVTDNSILEDKQLMKRLLEHCVAQWTVVESELDSARERANAIGKRCYCGGQYRY